VGERNQQVKVKKSENMLRDKFSHSKLTLFSKCPRKAFYHYVAKIKTPSPEYFKAGRAVHEGQEWDNLERIKGNRPKMDDVIGVAVARYEREKGVEPKRFLIDHQKQMTAYWKSGARDSLHPREGTVESCFNLLVNVSADPDSEPAEPARIEGFIDVIMDKEDLDTGIVTDYKTVTRPVYDKEADSSVQNSLYMLGSEVSAAMNISFIKEGRQHANCKLTKIARMTDAKMQYLLTVLADTIGSFRKNLKSGDWPKCFPGCYWCGPNDCDYYGMCYPAKNPQLNRFIQVTKILPTGTVPVPEWKTRKDK
jgi:hypothetical protein